MFVVAGSLDSDFSQKIAFVSIRSGAAGNLRDENDANEGKWFNFGAESGHEARSSVSNVRTPKMLTTAIFGEKPIGKLSQ